MAVASSLSLSLFSTAAAASVAKRVTAVSSLSASNDPSISLSSEHGEVSSLKRRQLLAGFGGALTASSLTPLQSASAEEMMKMYQTYTDREDGYTYIYPSDWRDFDFRGHDSAFKDRYMQLQNVRVRFIPTKKKDIHEFGPMEQVITDLITHVYAAPIQRPTIYSMEEVWFRVCLTC